MWIVTRAGRTPWAVAGLLALVLLSACRGSQATPEGTVRGFLDAVDRRDTEAFHASFTGETRVLIEELEMLSKRAEAQTGQPPISVDDWCQAFCGGVVESSTLHGDSATVGVRVVDDVNTLAVVRTDDGWRITLAERLAPAVQLLRLTVDGAEASDDGS